MCHCPRLHGKLFRNFLENGIPLIISSCSSANDVSNSNRSKQGKLLHPSKAIVAFVLLLLSAPVCQGYLGESSLFLDLRFLSLAR